MKLRITTPEPAVLAVKSNELLLDAFSRIREAVESIIEGLDDAALRRRPAKTGNSIAWLVWHLARVEDVQVAEAAGLEQVYLAEDFVSRFNLPLSPDETGYGHSSAQVDAVQAPPDLLLGYYHAVHRQTNNFVRTLTEKDLDRIVDLRWNPPVTLGVRLISTVADGLQHVGQAAYVKGLATGE